MTLSINSTHTLHTGTQMPSLGYGVYLSERDKCVKSVSKAIEVGYRHVDCAQYYANEDRESMSTGAVASTLYLPTPANHHPLFP